MSPSDSQRWLAILRATLDATTDGLLVVDEDGKIVFHNRRFAEMWGIPEDVAKAADDNELLGFASEKVQDWDEFIELVNHLYTHPTAVRRLRRPARTTRTPRRARVTRRRNRTSRAAVENPFRGI